MRYKLQFSKQAAADLEEIFDYIAITLKAPIAAKKLMAKVDHSINLLKEQPEAYPLFDVETLQMLGFRKLVVSSFVVVYCVNQVNKTVRIVRVLYGRQNYMKYFGQ